MMVVKIPQGKKAVPGLPGGQKTGYPQNKKQKRPDKPKGCY